MDLRSLPAVSLLCLAALAGCKKEPQVGKLKKVDPPPAPYDSPVFKVELETVPKGKYAFYLCESSATDPTKVDEKDGTIRTTGFEDGTTKPVCVMLYGYATGIGRELDRHTYTVTVLPKKGFEPEALAAAMRTDVDAMVAQLAKLEGEIGRAGRALPTKCPAGVAGKVAFASAEWVRRVARGGPKDPNLWVWPGPLTWYIAAKDESGQRPVEPRHRGDFARVRTIAYAAIVGTRELKRPLLLGEKFVPGKGAVDVYVGDLSSGKLLCRAAADFSSSKVIEWRSRAAHDAREAAGESATMAMKLESDFVGNERERHLASDFQLAAKDALFGAVKGLSPGFEPVSNLYFR